MATTSTSCRSPFTLLSDDLILNILGKLESDPREWARLCCVSLRFSSLINFVCYKAKCLLSSPSDLLLPTSAPPPPPWPSIHKLSVCCPGLHHSGVLLQPHFSDFGLELDIGPDRLFRPPATPPPVVERIKREEEDVDPSSWSLFDDLYFDTIYDFSEAHLPPLVPSPRPNNPHTSSSPFSSSLSSSSSFSSSSSSYSSSPHLAAGERWNLSREQGRKLLASRFRNDALFLSKFPGCVHVEERRSYMVFRGVFRDFKSTKVWRSLRDGKRRPIHLPCAYCDRNETWDLHSAFCLRRAFGYHDDGEPVVRAYVCENGHVAGAWTDLPTCYS